MQKADDMSLIINKALFRDIFQSLRDLFGQEAGTVLFHIGTRSGSRSAEKRLRESNGNIIGSLRRLTNIKREQGWAIIRFSENNGSRHISEIKIEKCFEAYGHDAGAQCHFIKGFLTGFLSKVYRQEMVVSIASQVKPCNGSCEMSVQLSESQRSK